MRASNPGGKNMVWFILALLFLVMKQPILALVFLVLGLTIGSSSRRR